jgi:hypothetical protein
LYVLAVGVQAALREVMAMLTSLATERHTFLELDGNPDGNDGT